MNALTTDEGPLNINHISSINESTKVANDSENNNNTAIINNTMRTNNANDNSLTNNIPHNNNNKNVNNTPDSISTFDRNNTLIHNAYYFNMQLFQKLSSLYNAVISSSVMNDIIDKSSSSPKSGIELFQRFVQIIKELELGFEVSPYAKYFYRLDEYLWQIKNDSELFDDRTWKAVTSCIFAIHDIQTGKLINSNIISMRRNIFSLINNGDNNKNNIDNNGSSEIGNENIGKNNTTTTATTINNINSKNNVSNTPSGNNSKLDDNLNTTSVSNTMSTGSTITTNTKSKKKYTRKTTFTKQTTGKKVLKSIIQKSTWKNNRNVRSNSNIG